MATERPAALAARTKSRRDRPRAAKPCGKAIFGCLICSHGAADDAKIRTTLGQRSRGRCGSTLGCGLSGRTITPAAELRDRADREQGPCDSRTHRRCRCPGLAAEETGGDRGANSRGRARRVHPQPSGGGARPGRTHRRAPRLSRRPRDPDRRRSRACRHRRRGGACARQRRQHLPPVPPPRPPSNDAGAGTPAPTSTTACVLSWRGTWRIPSSSTSTRPTPVCVRPPSRSASASTTRRTWRRSSRCSISPPGARAASAAGPSAWRSSCTSCRRSASPRRASRSCAPRLPPGCRCRSARPVRPAPPARHRSPVPWPRAWRNAWPA